MSNYFIRIFLEQIRTLKLISYTAFLRADEKRVKAFISKNRAI